MNISIKPSPLSGQVAAVASKSDAHRHIIAAAFADKPTKINLSCSCEDIEATLSCVKSIGAEIETGNGFVVVNPVNENTLHHSPLLDCGESGTTARLLLPLAAAICGGFTMTGRGRLPERPFLPLIHTMRENGCSFSSENLPFEVSGRLLPGEFVLPGDVSSQFISGLLFALPLLGRESRIITTSPLESVGYINMTLSVLKSYGIEVLSDNGSFTVPGGQKYISPGEITVEGDWSNAAFWLVSGALCDKITVSGLKYVSAQGDRAVIKVLKRAGAKISAGQDFVSAAPGELFGTEIDASQIPDLVPVLAVLGAAAPGKTIIKNAQRLRLKESDRLGAIAKNLRALGVDIRETADGLVIEGGTPLSGGVLESFNDHRIVMAAAVCSVLCRDRLIIENAQAVSKSYPSFFEDFKALGGKYDVV